MPAYGMQTWKKRTLQGCGLAIFLGWIVWLCVAIANEPPGGAASLEALRNDVRTAVQQNDADRLQSLFDEDSVADGYAKSFLGRLKGADALDSTLEKRGDVSYVVVKGGSRNGAAACTPWAATEKESRWYLDGTPPAVGGLC
ncbi:hypothetical protein ACF08M_35885 [Streptomyces sp. NPDC015032]|uniref:hypothetical protein n=1 Tax=Streptomyces sp. NPDC015032 TaxID=3364937 RepID=UPI0036FBF217